jgi:DNA-binding MarR family transcriptional regulator
MNKAVELLVNWDAFNDRFPSASLEDFYRYGLANTKKRTDAAQERGALLKVMGRIMSAFSLYHRTAMRDVEMPSAESFFFLNGIAHLGEVRKTQLINYLFFEYTTGMEALKKLIDTGMVTERPDPSDRRATLLALTPQGEKLLTAGYRQSSKVTEILLQDLESEDISLVLHLLRDTEKKHSRLAIELKNKTFEEIYENLTQ